MAAFDPFEEFGEIEDFAENLGNPDATVRRLAVKDLGETASAEAIPHLVAATNDPVAEVRLQAALALGDFDGPDVAAGVGARRHRHRPERGPGGGRELGRTEGSGGGGAVVAL